MMYRLIDGEIHKRNSDGHYMPLSLAEAEHVVQLLNTWMSALEATFVSPVHLLPNALDLLDRFDHSDTEPPKDSQ